MSDPKLRALKEKQEFNKNKVKNHFERLMHRLKSQRLDINGNQH